MIAAFGLSLSGVAGFGGGILVLPVLVWVYGPEVAVPVVAIFQLFGTFSRVWLNREFLNWRVVAWFATGSVPFAVMGSFLFINSDTALLTRIMGGAMIALVVLTQLPWSKRVGMKLWGFFPLGATSGFLASVIGVPGPFAPVFYIAYGMSSREYIATFSLGMLLIQPAKLAIYGGGELLTPLVVWPWPRPGSGRHRRCIRRGQVVAPCPRKVVRRRHKPDSSGFRGAVPDHRGIGSCPVAPSLQCEYETERRVPRIKVQKPRVEAVDGKGGLTARNQCTERRRRRLGHQFLQLTPPAPALYIFATDTAPDKFSTLNAGTIFVYNIANSSWRSCWNEFAITVVFVLELDSDGVER